MSAATAARSAFRSAGTRFRSSGHPKTTSFNMPTHKPAVSSRILRCPVEMSCLCLESMLPYHTATASALLTSMLSAAPRSYAWTLQDCNDDV